VRIGKISEPKSAGTVYEIWGAITHEYGGECVV